MFRAGLFDINIDDDEDVDMEHSELQFNHRESEENF